MIATKSWASVTANVMIAEELPSWKATKLYMRSIAEQPMQNPRGMVAIRLAALMLRFLLKRNKFSRLKGMASSSVTAARKRIRARKSSCPVLYPKRLIVGIMDMNIQNSIQHKMCLAPKLFMINLGLRISPIKFLLNILLFGWICKCSNDDNAKL